MWTLLGAAQEQKLALCWGFELDAVVLMSALCSLLDVQKVLDIRQSSGVLWGNELSLGGFLSCKCSWFLSNVKILLGYIIWHSRLHPVD